MSEVRMVLGSVTAFIVVWLMVACRGACRGRKLICCQAVEARWLSVALIYINECDGKTEACKQIEKRERELSCLSKQRNVTLSQTKKEEKKKTNERG